MKCRMRRAAKIASRTWGFPRSVPLTFIRQREKRSLVFSTLRSVNIRLSKIFSSFRSKGKSNSNRRFPRSAAPMRRAFAVQSTAHPSTLSVPVVLICLCPTTRDVGRDATMAENLVFRTVVVHISTLNKNQFGRTLVVRIVMEVFRLLTMTDRIDSFDILQPTLLLQ